MKIDLFSTTPQSVDFRDKSYMDEIKKASQYSEQYGFKGTLIYCDNRLADPWIITCAILAATVKLLPLIALQPVYMHPYTVAKKIASIGLLYDRQVALNLVAGGFVHDLNALNDYTPHDRRYDRLAEYTEIIQLLLTSTKPVSYSGEFYKISNLTLSPHLQSHLQPEYYLSGSSEVARKTAIRLGATLIEYPEPQTDFPGLLGGDILNGMRIGILARKSQNEAWSDAGLRFPKTRTGQISHQFAEKTTDSSWHKVLSGISDFDQSEKSVYWLGPFKQYQTFCPYLVGDYDEVALELSGYLRAGCSTCILDIPASEIDLASTVLVFNRATKLMETV